MEKQWAVTTNSLYKSVLLFSIAGICASVFSMIPLTGFLENAFDICVVFGYAAFIIRLEDLSLIVNENDAKFVKNIKLGMILYVVALALDFFPAVGWILSGLVSIAAFVLLLMAYMNLKKSETFPETGRNGASTLFLAMILGVVASVLCIIPVIGTILGGILFIVCFVMNILGWKKIAEPVAVQK